MFLIAYKARAVQDNPLEQIENRLVPYLVIYE